MTENTALLCDANNDDLPDDIPLGNHSPLLVPPPLGQSFLQPKFIYPLGAVSLVNPDNLAAENDFEPINSFDGSPFFDQPLQSNFSTAVETQATNQPNIQTKALAAGNRLQQSVQAKRSPINPPQSNSIQRKTVGSSQAQPPNSPLNLPSQELSANPSLNHDFHPSLDADTSENIAVQRSDDLTIIDRTNSNSDRPIQTESSLFTVENNQTNTLQRQADGSNVDNITQSEYLQQNYSEINLPNPAANLTSSNLQQIQRSPIADNISESDRLEKYQITSDSSTADIQNAQIHQLNSELPLTDSDTVSDSLAGDRTIQRASNLVDTANIPQVSQVPQADAIQRKANTAPVSNPVSSNPVNSPVDNPINNIPQVDLTQQIQGQTDLSNSENTAVSNNTQQIQRFAESPVLDRVAESDRTIQREPSLSSVDNTQPFQSAPLQQSGIYSGISNENTIPEVNPTIQRESLGSVADITQSNEVQRQTDVNRISQADYTQLAQTDEIQRQPDLSTRDSTPAINSNPSSQMSSEAPIASESDRPIQQSSTLPNIDIRQSPQTTSIQRQADQPNIADLAESSSSPANNNSQQIQSPIEPAVLKDVPESDQTIQRQSDSELTDRAIFSTDEIQRQPDASVANNISESEYIQPIQRQLDKSIPNDNPLHKNIQPIPETSEAPVLDNLIQDNRRTIQREVDLPSPVDISQDLQTNEIQRQADSSNGNSVPEKDIHLSSDDITQNSLTDNVQRQPDLFAVDNNIVGDSRTQPIQSEPDLSTFGISTNKDPQQIQRFSDSDISRVDHISEGIQRESSLSPELSQSRQTDAIQKETNVSVVGSVDQSDRTIQRETDLSPTDSTPTPQSNVIQRQPDISTVDNNISEDSLTQQIQKTSDFPNSDIANSNIPQTTRASEFPIFDSITESDRPQQVQTNPDVQTSDISANRDSQQIQRLVDTNVSDVDTNSENIQRRTDLSADVPTQFQADTAQRQSDILLANNAFQSDRSVQREQDLSPIDSTQIPHINEIQRQTDISEVDSISQSDRTETIQRNYDLSSTDSKQTYQADIIQKQPDISTLSSSISEDSLTQEIQRTSDLPDSDITPNNIQQIAEVSESPVLGSITESDRTQQIQTKPGISSSDSSTNRDPQQIQRLVDNNVSDVDINSENVQRRTDLFAVEPTEFQADTIQMQSDISLVDNAFQSDRTVQREQDLSPIDSTQILHTDEIQRQTDISEVASISQSDRLIQSNADLLVSVDSTQIPQANVIQRQPDVSTVDNNISGDNLTQQVQRTSNLPDSDITPNNIPQTDRASESSISGSITQSDRTQKIQTKTDVSTSDISTNRDPQQIQRLVDTDISDVDINSENAQRITDLSAVEPTEFQANTTQRQSDVSLVDNAFQSDRTIQRESDLSAVDNKQYSQINEAQKQSDGFMGKDIQPLQRFSEPPILDSFPEGDPPIQKASESSPVERMQILHTNEIQKQPDTLEVNSIAESDHPIQRDSDLSSADSTQLPQVEGSQRELDISTVDNSIFGGDRPQPIQTKPDVQTSDISANRDSQQIQRIDNTDISAVGSISESIQQKSDDSAIDDISQGDRTVQRKSDLFNNIDITQSPYSNDTQRQSDVSLNSLTEGDVSQQIKQTDPSISDSNNLTNIVQPLQRETDISTVDIQQNDLSDELQRQSDLSLVDNSISGDNHTQQIQRTSDLPNSDSDAPSNTQQVAIAEDNTSSTEQNIQRDTELFNSIVSPQSFQTTDNQETSSLPVDAAEIMSQGNLAPQTQPTNLSIADGFITSNSDQSIQRESLVDNSSQNDRNISSSRDISALDSKQDSQANEIQRQPNISDVDRIAQSDRSTIQSNSDLTPVSSTQTPQVDGIQRQIASELSPVDITQSSPTSEIQRLSNISVDDITQGDLTQATQRTDSTTDSNTDSSVNTIQRQSDVTVTDLSQSNYTPQRGSNEADVNIKNDITSSLQNETIQRQLDHDISTVDNVYQNNSVIQRESDLSVVDTTQSSVTNDAQSKLQREIVDSTVDNISQVDRIQPVQRNLNNSEANNVDSTLAIDRPNVIQREIDLVALEPEVSSQISENLDHENRQQIQKKPDQEKEDTTNNQTSVEQNTNQTILQMLADPSNTEDLQLPKAIENLAHTDYLGNFSLLPSLQTSSPITSQAIQRSPTKRPDQPTQSSLPNSLNNFAKTIQPMQDKNSDSSNSQTNSTGWANISELLANLPPSPKASSSTSSLNKQTNTGDRSPLATSPSSSSTSSNGNQTTIQRSLDKTTYKDNDIEQDLYLTPSGLQKGNPHKIANTRPNAIQRELTSDTLPEVKVSVNSRQDPNNDSYDKENFEKNLETLAQEIYILLRHRLEIEKERQGGKYQGRLPW
ncbi:MAG: hypothetical protein ACKO7R_06790 [Pseudanabaena sp.]